MAPIRRVTMFNAKSEDDVKLLLEKYSTLQAEAKKDGKPYIHSTSAGRSVADPRSPQGITFSAVQVFSSPEDMKYYDEEDPVHGAMKASLKGRLAGPPSVVVFQEEVST